MITLINIIVVAILSFISVSLFPHFRIFGVVPILPLFFIIQFAYFRSGFEPLILAAAAGLFFDLFSASPFGFYLLLFLGTATVVRYFFDEGLRALSVWPYLLISELAVLVYLASQLVYLWLRGVRPEISVSYQIISSMIVNGVFALLLYAFGRYYFDWVVKFEDFLKRR